MEKKKLYEEFPQKHPNRRLSENRNKWTYPEKVAADWFDKNLIPFEKNKRIGKYYPDFVIKENIIIEIDGEFWHDAEKDKIRDDYLTSQGYIVYRIKAKEKIEERLESLLITCV